MNLEPYYKIVIDWAYIFIPKLAGALVVFIVGIYVTNFISKIFSKGLKRNGIDVSLQTFLGSLVTGGLRVLLLITVAGMLGIQTTSFVAVVGALGLAVGLALQGSLANFAGGVLLLVFKPFKVGDLIESNGQIGNVLEIQIFNTILLTSDQKTIILANGGVSNSTIVNYSRHGSLRVDLNFFLDPATNIDYTKDVVLKTLSTNSFVLTDPAPIVGIVSVANGMIHLAVRPFAASENYWSAYFSLQEDIKRAFELHEIKGPTPTTVVINK